MAAVEELKNGFSTYFAEMDSCQAAGCYLALLHLVVVLPNICAALESRSGEAHGTEYMKWCDEFLVGDSLSSIERWEMRCALLHQGTTLTDARARGRYASYSFLRISSAVTVVIRSRWSTPVSHFTLYRPPPKTVMISPSTYSWLWRSTTTSPALG